MHRLTVEDHFDSAHFLRNYIGKCANVHGHMWRVQVCIMGDVLQQNGILADFKILKSILHEFLDKLDHQLINEIKPFDSMNPTAENLAKYIYEQLWGDFLKIENIIGIDWVKVWETPACCSEYSK